MTRSIFIINQAKVYIFYDLYPQLTTWFMGLQDLTPRSKITLSRGQLLWRRASMKVKLELLSYSVDVYIYILFFSVFLVLPR